jgi:hypothetical protein
MVKLASSNQQPHSDIGKMMIPINKEITYPWISPEERVKQ